MTQIITPITDVPAICQSLRVLADMAYRQHRLRFYGHLSDAAVLLLKAYAPERICSFCTEFLDACRCDHERQAMKDEEETTD